MAAVARPARKDVLRWVTHPPADQVDAYTTLPWEALCEAVSHLRVQLLEGKILPLQQPLAAASGSEVAAKWQRSDDCHGAKKEKAPDSLRNPGPPFGGVYGTRNRRGGGPASNVE